MKRFKYRVKDSSGRFLTGVVETSDKNLAVRALHRKGYVVVSLQEKRFSSLTNLTIVGVSSKDVVAFTQQLATMITSGLTMSSALDIIKEQSGSALAKILEQVIREIQEGNPLHSALAKYPRVFSNLYLSLVKSGEASGQLDKVLNELAKTLEKRDVLRSKIKSALVYPALIVIAMIIVAFLMMVFVIPELARMYEEMDLDFPFMTQVLISVSNFVAKFWYIVIVAVVGANWVFLRWRKTPDGRSFVDSLILKIPVFGHLRVLVILAEVTNTLSMLVSAGVPIIKCLGIVAEASGNYVFETSLSAAAKNVEKGLTLADALSRHEEYPSMLIQMIAVGEETGKVAEILQKVSRRFELEADTAITGLTAAMEPFIMIMLGIGVGFLVFAVITPLYKLIATI